MKMTASRHLSVPFVAILFLAIAAASITACLAGSNAGNAAGVEQRSSSELTGGWHLVRTSNPRGDADAISIMHTADTSRSDLDLAGLMIRCSSNGRAEVVVVLIQPFPLRARPRVALGKPGHEIQLEATVAPPGTAIVLPTDATTLVRGSWQALNDLFIRVDDGQDTIRGVVVLSGLQAAFNELVASSPAQ